MEDGTVPTDNPFVNKKGARPEIFTLGNRNRRPEVGSRQIFRNSSPRPIVSAEHGLRGLSDTAARGLERLRVRAEQKS